MNSQIHFLLLASAVQLPPTKAVSRLCTRSVTHHVVGTRIQSFTETIRERTNCGVFGWSRCTTTRTAVAYTTVTYLQPYTVEESTCCDGWTNSSVSGAPPCSIHTLPPQVLRCQASVTVPGASTALERALIRWQPPIFAEPHNYSLLVTSSVGEPAQRWHWGTYVVTYTATSTNNNRSATCVMRINVSPPSSEPRIDNLANNSQLIYVRGQLLYASCASSYSSHTADLFWRLNGSVHLPPEAVVHKKNSSVDLFDTYREFSTVLYILHAPSTLHAVALDCVSVLTQPPGAELVARLLLEAVEPYQLQTKNRLELPFPAWVLAPAVGGVGLIVLLVCLCLLTRHPDCCSCQRLRKCRPPDLTPFCDALLRPPEKPDKRERYDLQSAGSNVTMRSLPESFSW